MRLTSLQAATIAVITACALFTAAASAQGATPSTHGIPTPEKVYGDGKTVPVKVETRTYDQKAILATMQASEEVKTGRILWVQKCAFCHDGLGAPTYKTMGPWIDSDIMHALGDDAVRTFIGQGDLRMPGFRYQLDATQVNDVIAFLKGVSPKDKPTPAQLAGRNTGVNSD